MFNFFCAGIDFTGQANCHYIAHQSDRQSQNAPKGYIARQEMTLEIAHIGLHIGRLHNCMLWMHIEPSPHRLRTFFSGAYFNKCRAPINATFGRP